MSGFYRLRGARDRDNLDVKKAQTLLEEFREIVGDDPIETAVQAQRQAAARERYQESVASTQAASAKLEELNRQFLLLSSGKDHTPQQRGFALESLFFDLVHLAEIEHRRPFRTPIQEQIDGHLKFEKFDYLVETKWIAGWVKQEHLSVFDGKIRGKAQSTRGLFLAAEGFDPNAIRKFSGDSPRILLMTGEDLALVLSGTLHLADLLKAKVDAMVRHGTINLPARSLI